MADQKLKTICPTCKKIRFITRSMLFFIKNGINSGNCKSCSLRGNKYRLGTKQSKETRNKIKLAHLGRKNSIEHNKNISKAKMGIKTGIIPRSAFKKGIYTEVMRKGSLASAKKIAERKMTSIERKVYEELKTRKLSFEMQKLINGKFLVDFYIKKFNLIIEVDGDYWHSLPRVIKKDMAENAYLSKCGYNLLRLSEREINNDSFKERMVI
jgi:very-short-patch-repair endonuclease